MVTNSYSVLKKSIILSVLIFLSACSLQAHERQNALLPSNSKQARTEIVKLVSQSLGGQKNAITEDVFQHSSRLLLGKKSVMSPGGVKIYGADKTFVLIFELAKENGNCLLIRKDTKQEWQLITKRCFTR